MKFLIWLALFVAIAYGTVYYFSTYREKQLIAEYQAAADKFYDENNRYPRSFRELEATRYIAEFTSRDHPPKDGRWAYDTDKNEIYIKRYLIDDEGNYILDRDGRKQFKREYYDDI